MDIWVLAQNNHTLSNSPRYYVFGVGSPFNYEAKAGIFAYAYTWSENYGYTLGSLNCYHKVLASQTVGDYIIAGAGNRDHQTSNSTTEYGLYELYARPNFGTAAGQGSLNCII